MNVDPEGMARSLHEAADSITCNTNAAHEVPDAIDAIRLVAVTLENVIEPDASADDMLEWVMEHTPAGHRNEAHVGMSHGVNWIDDNGDEEYTASDSYRSAIGKAMRESAGKEGSEATTQVTETTR